LFNETAGNFIIEVKDVKTAKEVFRDLPFLVLGKTQENKKIEVSSDKKIFSIDLYDLKNSWQKPMKKMFP
jgi:hypothetical protein